MHVSQGNSVAGNKSRSKGAKGMLDARKLLRYILGCSIHLIHRSRRADILGADIMVDLGTPSPMVRPALQVKVRKKIAGHKFLMDSLSEDGLGVIKQDGGPWLLLANLDRFKEIVDERRQAPYKIISKNLQYLDESQREKLRERLK